MNGTAVKGAIWVNDLCRLDRPEWRRGEYALQEVGARVEPLAGAMGVETSVVRGRLERSCRAFVAWAGDDEVASWLWVSMGREWAPPLRMELRFAPDECYSWDAGTLPAHRGRGLFTALLRCAGWQMAREGRRLMWGGILDENLASRRACAAAGWRPALRLVAILEPVATRLRVRRADYAELELVRRARRMLRLPEGGRDR